MQQVNLSLKIKSFWEWFQENEEQFVEVTDVRAAKEAMDNQVLEFGLFSWEIGEGTGKPYYLTISPNGDGERLRISQLIVGAAPAMQEWEFNYCKPPRDWDFRFEMYDMFLEKKEFDAAGWEYALITKPDNYVELIIRAGNLDLLDEDDRLDAGDLVVTNILGEELVINYLYALEMVKEFKPELRSISKKMPNLRNDFERVIFEPG